eukprot:gene600-7875_t
MSTDGKVLIITGNSLTGLSAIQHILEKEPSAQIRACVRKKCNAEELRELPVEVITGDITQTHLLDPVFDGVTRAYFSIPTSEDRVRITKCFVDACFKFGVDHAVMLSTLQAELQDTLFQKHFNEIENYVMEHANKPVHLKLCDKGHNRFKPTILRCAMFYQARNMYLFVPVLQTGHLYLPLRDCALAHVDMEDVGECIASILLDPSKHENRVYNLVGEYQRGNMIASAISMGAKVHCTYENVEPAIMMTSLEEIEVKPWRAHALTEMVTWYQSPQSQDIASDIESIVGHPPTKFRHFVARDLKPMLEVETVEN